MEGDPSGREEVEAAAIKIKGGVLKYLRFSKILFHGQKRKKIYSPTHPFLMIKNCIHVTHKMHPPLALF